MPGTKLMFFSLKCLAPTCLRVLRIGYWVSEKGMKGSGCPPLISSLRSEIISGGIDLASWEPV